MSTITNRRRALSVLAEPTARAREQSLSCSCATTKPQSCACVEFAPIEAILSLQDLEEARNTLGATTPQAYIYIPRRASISIDF